MKREALRTEIAFICPECGYSTVGLLGGLSAISDMLRLKCSCGGSALDIRKTSEGRVHLSIPCVYCKDNHGYTLSQDTILDRDLTKLSCPYANMDIAFMGDEDKIPDELERVGHELETVLKTFEAESLSDIQPSDFDADTECDPAIYDAINFLVRDLEADGGVVCPCKSGNYELRFIDGGIEVYCKECGASYAFAATSGASCEQYMGLDRIELK